MRGGAERTLAGLVAAAAMALPAVAGTEWAKAYRDNFVDGCVKSTAGMADADKAARRCDCMARALEARVSEERMTEIEKMQDGEQKKAAMVPLLEAAKAACQEDKK